VEADGSFHHQEGTQSYLQKADRIGKTYLACVRIFRGFRILILDKWLTNPLSDEQTAALLELLEPRERTRVSSTVVRCLGGEDKGFDSL